MNLVPSLFESLAKIIYVPNTVNIEDIIFDGGQLYRHKENNKKKKSRKKPNEIVERVNRVIKFKKYFKLYERSDDKNRVRVPLKRNASKKFVKAYRNKHLDRVRFEYNLVREQLRKKKINTLGDLASYTNSEGVNILHLLNEKLQFKVIDVGDRKNDYLCIMSTINEKIKNQAKKRIK